ncbi:hypothetical protein HDU93_001468 [Gonapodya sp. JEL0774]|nr:hypothetical protein HDU93_001468 [Gonapodya sp. JEL0774]
MNGLSDADLEEFDDFVDEYTSKLNAIMEGKFTEDDLKDLEKDVQKRTGGTEAASVAGNTAEKSAAVSNPSSPLKPKTKSDPLDYSKWNSINATDDDDDSQSSNAKPKPQANSKSTSSPQIPVSERRRVAAANFVDSIKTRVREESQRYRDNAAVLFKQAKYAEAVKEYQAAIDVCERPPQSLMKPQSTSADNLMKGSETRTANGAIDLSVPIGLAALSPSATTTYAIPVDPLLHTNLSLCHFRLSNYLLSIHHASLAIALDPTCVKAWWRRCEAHKALGELESALENAKEVVKLVEMEVKGGEVGASIAESEAAQAGTAGSKRAGAGASFSQSCSTVTLDSARRLARTLELALADQAAVASGSANISLGQEKTLANLVDLFCTRITSTASGSSNSSSDAQRTVAGTALASALIDSTPAATLFRARGGFDRLLSPSIFNATTAQYVLPVLVAAVSDCPANKRELAKHLATIVEVMRAAKEDPKAATDLRMASYGVKLIGLCVQEEVFVDALVGQAPLIPPASGTPSLTATASDLFLVSLLSLVRHPLPTKSSLDRTMTPLACDVPTEIMVIFGLIAPRWIARSPQRAKEVIGAFASVVQGSKAVKDGEAEKRDRKVAAVRYAAMVTGAMDKLKGSAGAVSAETWTRLVRAATFVIRCETEADPEAWHESSVVLDCLAVVANAVTLASAAIVDSADDDHVEGSAVLVASLIAILRAALSKPDVDPCTFTESFSRTMLVLSKLAKNQRSVLELAFIDDAWEILGPRLAKILQLRGGHIASPGGDDSVEASLADRVLRIVAGYLSPVDTGELSTRVRAWEVLGGLEGLVRCAEGELARFEAHKTEVRSRRGWDAASKLRFGEEEGRVIGHVAWCLGECAKDVKYAGKLYSLGAVEPLLSLLRVVHDNAVQKNLAIAVGRLCSDVKARDRVRELKGFELLTSLSSKVVKK